MASSSAPEKHAADQAGGDKEVVFSSDGLEPVKIAFPVNDSSSSPTDGDDLLDTSAPMTAEQAFEVFAGKLYVANPHAHKKNQTQQTEDAEGPLQRLGRLQREVEELQEDVKDSESAAIFQDQLAQLQKQLESLSTAQLQKQEILANSIQKSVEGIQDSDKSAVVAAEAATLSPETEQRLKRLEMVLGASSNNNNRNQSLMDRLEALERLPLDDKKVDLVQKRVKVIRQDLEAAAKARNKLMAASSSASAEDSKSIAALYDQLQLLQGVSQHLPALSARLQSLAHQHVDAATRAARFRAVEQVSTNLSRQVAALEGTLQTLETSVQENAASMQQNIRALEERMKGSS